MASDDNKWSRPTSPPPPLYVGEKERNLVKQINDEILERIVGQTIAYYGISYKHTNYHSVYGEAIKKTFYPPVVVKALVMWEGSTEVVPDYFTADESRSILVSFHKRRLTEDQDLYVRLGDFILYGGTFYELVKLEEPRLLFGQIDHKFEITAKCIKARQGLFDGM